MSLLFVYTRPHELYLDDDARLASRPPRLPSIQAPDVCIALPLLSLTPCTTNTNTKAQLKALVKGAYRMVVAVSTNAVVCAWEQLDINDRQAILSQNQQGALVMVAVGYATCQALETLGFVVATPAKMSNEGMLEMPEVLALGAHDKVLFWRGTTGRTVLAEGLRYRLVEVDFANLYERTCPKELFANTLALKAHYQTHKMCVILISSEQSFLHWQKAADEVGIDWQSFCYLTLGARLTDTIAPFANTVQVEDLSPDTLIHALMHLKQTHSSTTNPLSNQPSQT